MAHFLQSPVGVPTNNSILKCFLNLLFIYYVEVDKKFNSKLMSPSIQLDSIHSVHKNLI